VLAEIQTKLLPYCTHVGHPGYMGLITPSPNPIGVIGDFPCSALNQNVGAYSIGPAAVAIERRTIRWLTDLVGYGPAAGGNLTSGGMMANFIGLKLARDWASGDRAQHDGIHGCLRRRHAALLRIAHARPRPRVGGLRHHRSAQVIIPPLDAGAVLVKDERRLTASFGMKPSYLTDELDPAGERYQYYVHGFEQSRRFRSLKVWMNFKRYGSRQIGDWIDNNVRQAAHLYALVSQHPDFEAASRPPMSAVCIRFRAAALSENDAKQLHANQERVRSASSRNRNSERLSAGCPQQLTAG
jgi:glutamate/tyrosine decarboxylase-like PLP-dependent enzyme